MKIAQIAPLIESVPPRLYGGTERVVSYLTEDLVAQGHEVTLFASGDSITAANLVPCCTQALRLDSAVSDVVPYYMLMLDKVRSHAAEFDVLHFHIDHFHFPIFRHLPIPSLTTLHGRQDHRDCLPFFAGFSDMPLISISDAQRAPLPHANFVTTIHHGLPLDLHEASYRPKGGYLAFIGRISPEKGPVDAIRIAQSLGIPLKIAAKVDEVDREYFKTIIEPLINEAPGVEFIGEINETQKSEFLGNALALLFTIDWPEPFGLVGPEAGLHGVPAAAYAVGGILDWLHDGVNGFLAPSQPATSAGLQEAIVKCLGDQATYAHLCSGAKTIARGFTDLDGHVRTLVGQVFGGDWTDRDPGEIQYVNAFQSVRRH